MQKSILVIGGTGYLGGQVINHLLSRNILVSALARQGSDTRGLESKGVKLFLAISRSRKHFYQP